jgi:hypothetical protein
LNFLTETRHSWTLRENRVQSTEVQLTAVFIDNLRGISRNRDGDHAAEVFVLEWFTNLLSPGKVLDDFLNLQVNRTALSWPGVLTSPFEKLDLHSSRRLILD